MLCPEAKRRASEQGRVTRLAGRRRGKNFGLAALGLMCLGLFLGFAPGAQALTYPDKLELINLLETGSLNKLERRLEVFQSAFENGRASDQWVESAYLAFANSDPRLAEKLDRWVESAPDSYAALGARGVYFWRLGWMARGSETGFRPSRDQIRLMREFFALAEADLETAIDLRPEFSLAYALLIDIGMVSDRRDDQTFLMRRALKVVPGTFVVRERYLASLEPAWRPQWSDEQSLEEITHYASLVQDATTRFPRLLPLTGYGHFVRAKLTFAAGDHTTAKGLIALSLRAGQFWRYHDLAGRIQMRERQCGLALLSFDHALAQRPQDAALFGLRGEARRCIDGNDGALDDWDRALAFDAMEPKYLLAKGEALFLLGRHDDARKLVEDATFYGAINASVRAARGALLVDQFGQFEAAAADFKLATEIAPDRVDYWLSYGDALLRANQCDALAALATYVRLCRDGSSCAPDDLAWAIDGIEQASRSDCRD